MYNKNIKLILAAIVIGLGVWQIIDVNFAICDFYLLIFQKRVNSTGLFEITQTRF